MKNLTDFRKTVETDVDPRLDKVSNKYVNLSTVVQKLDSAIPWISRYPGDKYYENRLLGVFHFDLVLKFH